MYRIGICDDNEADIQYLTSLVNAWAGSRSAQARIYPFLSADACLFHFSVDQGCDILLLDIEMGGMDGVALAKTLRMQNEAVQIAFVTGYAEYIAEGYEVSALHYLMKPVDSVKLSAVLDKAVRNLGRQGRAFFFGVNGGMARLEANEIVVVESFAHSCVMTTARGRLEVKTGISDIEKLLGEGFVRCHRSYLVGIRFIRSISRAEVVLDDGRKIPLSRGNYEAVNQAFIRYFRGD